MRMRTFLFVACVFIGIPQLKANPHLSSTARNPSDNLISSTFFYPKLSYSSPKKAWKRRRGENFVIEDGALKIPETPNEKWNSASIQFDCSAILVKNLTIKFDYSLKGNGSVKLGFKRFSLNPGDNMTFERQVPVDFPKMPESISFSTDGELAVKNLLVRPVKLQAELAKPLIFDGKQVRIIYYARTDEKNTWWDSRAAHMTQKNLYLAGAGILPIIELEKVQKVDSGIIIGQAAKDYIEADKLAELGEGGYALSVKNGIGAVYGKNSYSVPNGIFGLLKKLGFFYVDNQDFIAPQGEKLELTAMGETKTPAIPVRVDPWWVVNSPRVGMTDPMVFIDSTLIGSRCRHESHSLPYFIGWNEFKDSHREFFAMQADGMRRTNKRGDVHFCFSNQELQKITVQRIKELLDTNKVSDYMFLFPGDGGSMSCRCEDCEKLGKATDRLLFFTNQVAREIKKTHPAIKLLTLSYVDYRQPPAQYKPESNVIVLYCSYPPVWMNHLQTYHKDNSQGLKDLKEWVKCCPENMGAYVYPSSCEETLNVWPSFYANYEKFKYFAENKFKIIKFCGLRPWTDSLPGQGIFSSVQRYVLIQVLWNPGLDVEKEIDTYLKLYYGRAAPAVRKLFDMLHNEVKSRDLTQNTEESIRGFVTEKLMTRGVIYFDEALKAVGDEQPYRNRVEREKIYLLWSYLSDINRANGKLKPKDFPKYAKRLAELCELCEKYKVTYMGRENFKEWLWNTAMLEITGKGRWYDEILIKKLIKDPVKVLGGNNPRGQAKTNYGYRIPSESMFGGNSISTCWLREKIGKARQLFRPSSGKGSVKMLLTLPVKPKSSVILNVNGIDNEKSEPAKMELLVNGEKIYIGKVPWGKDKWSLREFSIPAEYLKAGDNEIQFLNITPDKEEFAQGRKIQRNYYWGWYIIDECQFNVKQ